jgi:hypothetical protein
MLRWLTEGLQSVSQLSSRSVLNTYVTTHDLSPDNTIEERPKTQDAAKAR